MRALPPASVFTVAEAHTLGWTHSALRHAVSAGRLRRVRRGVYTSLDVITPIAMAVGAVRSVAGAVISHCSAVLLHGLPLLHQPPARPDLTVPPDGTGDTTRARLHRATLLPGEVELIDGVPVTTVARTLIDLARRVSVGAAVVTIDAALNRSLVTYEELLEVIDRCRGWPNIRRAARAVQLSDPAAESPLESVSRLVIVLRLSLPRPRTQAIILDENGSFVGRCDFYWDHVGVFGEADGRSKYDGRDVLTGEKLRQEDLENLGLVGVRWGWRDLRYDQPRLRRRIENAFERGRLRDASGLPRKWSVGNPISNQTRGKAEHQQPDPGKS
jgi:hypothetical protein